MASLFYLILLASAERKWTESGRKLIQYEGKRTDKNVMVRLGLEPEPLSPTQACKRRSTKQSHVLALSHVYPRDEKKPLLFMEIYSYVKFYH